MRSRFERACWVMGAFSMLARVESCRNFGIGFGPSAWVGHAGEKWSLGTPQHGQMNQCEDFCAGVGVSVRLRALFAVLLLLLLLGEWMSGPGLGDSERLENLDW